MTTDVRRQLALVILAIILLISTWAFFAWSPSLVTAPGYGGTYIEGLVGAPILLNPLLSDKEAEQDLCRLIFDGLTEINARGEVVPALADRWEISKDGRSYVFYLRPNVYWHDGAPFTAQDVLYTISVLRTPGFPGPSELAAFWRDISVEAMSMFAVRFTLPQAFAPFPSYATLGLLPAHLLSNVAPHELKDHPFNRSPVGTGSFRVVEFGPERTILERHTQDFRPRPYLDRLEFRFYADEQALFAAYRDGQIDGLSFVPPQDIPRVWSDDSLELHSAPLAGYTAVFLNLESHIFADKTVRQALLYALDRQALVDDVLAGQGIVIDSPIPRFSWAYEPTAKKYLHDPARARRLLVRAGWQIEAGNPFRHQGDLELAFSLLTDDNVEHATVASILVHQWAQVGIRVEPVIVDRSKLYEQLLARHFDAALLDVRLSPDPDPYPLWHSTQVAPVGQNLSRWRNDAADLLLEEARVQSKLDIRRRLYGQFQELFAEEVPALLLYAPVYNYALSRRVRDVEIGPLLEASDRFRTIRQWYVVPKRTLP